MTEEKKKKSGEISRREFLKDAGLVVGGAAIGSTVLLAACGGEDTTKTVTEATTKTVTIEVPVPAEFNKLMVNGNEHELKLEPNWTLAYVLRDKLGLTGTKIACDQGVCGACTVLIDGEPTLSCTTLAIECDGKNILTIEGLQEGDELDKLQDSFVAHDAIQCGFCTPGMLMSAKALLNKNPNPTSNDIRKAISGNLCRCGAYTKIVEAIAEVS